MGIGESVEVPMNRRFNNPPQADPHAQLERALIEEYLQRRGQSLATLKELGAEEADGLLKEASLYASGRLTEVESRAHLVDELHRGSEPVAREPHGQKVAAAASVTTIRPRTRSIQKPEPVAKPRRRPLRWL
jgi:hypothetical protein